MNHTYRRTTNNLSAALLTLGAKVQPLGKIIGGSHPRDRRAAMTMLSAFVLRAVSMGTSVITVRLTFRYLGAERYGMWMTISSVVLMLGFADLGMSNGLVNVVADALGRGERAAAKRAISSGFLMLSAVALSLTIATAMAYPFLRAGRLFNVHSLLATNEAGPALLVLLVCFILSLPLGTVRGTQIGLQQGFINNLWATLGTFSSLGALLLAIHYQAGLPLLVLSLSAPPLAALIVNGAQLFAWSRPELRPSFSAVSRESATRLFKTGAMYFLLQLSLSIGMQTDNVVIAQIMGPRSVAEYAVPARLFNMVVSFLVMMSGAMLPAYADAIAKSDGLWIRKTYKRIALTGTVTTGVVAAALVVFGNRLLALWVGPQMHASPLLLAALATQCVLNAYLQPIFFLLNGIGQFRAQVTSGIAMSVLNLTLSILFVRLFGIVGAVLGTVIAILAVQVVPLTVVMKRQLQTFTQLVPLDGDFPSKTEIELALR